MIFIFSFGRGTLTYCLIAPGFLGGWGSLAILDGLDRFIMF